MRRFLSCAVLTALAACSRPTGALDHYVAAQPVASDIQMARLLELLRKGDVAAFNRLRTNGPYAGKRLDFRRCSLAGLSLPGADLSNSIFAGTDLTGADLNHASFRGSYLATASVAHRWMGATPTRRTCLANCDFTGAILKATEYVNTAEVRPWEFIDVRTKMEFQFDLANADISGAVGLAALSPLEK